MVLCFVQDQVDVVDAVRLDAVNEMTEQLNGTYVEEGVVSDDEKEESDGESTGCGGIAPPPYKIGDCTHTLGNPLLRLDLELPLPAAETSCSSRYCGLS